MRQANRTGGRARWSAPVLGLLLALVVAGTAHAQYVDYHHVGRDDGSAPDKGNWAWIVGEPETWPGLQVQGDVHWWIQSGWWDAARVQAVHARTDDRPNFEVELYDPGRGEGCRKLRALGVRLFRHLNPIPWGAIRVRIGPGDCRSGSTYGDLLEVEFLRTGWIRQHAMFDFSVDAEKLDGSAGEANLSWEAIGRRPLPVCGLSPNPYCEVWLGKVEFCPSGAVRACQPQGICSSNQPIPGC